MVRAPHVPPVGDADAHAEGGHRRGLDGGAAVPRDLAQLGSLQNPRLPFERAAGHGRRTVDEHRLETACDELAFETCVDFAFEVDEYEVDDVAFEASGEARRGGIEPIEPG